jgi:MFS superfamily sulfate permease-like transporter
LFLAPFLASAAAVVDQTLSKEGITSNTVFLASFAMLAAIGMFMSGSLLVLAATFKLANLGTFLPYSVLCGFFSAVGVLLWALAFSVDNNGNTWQKVFFSGDWNLIGTSLLHHLPSLFVGISMNLLGPKHPFYVILLIILTLIGFYATMWITGTSLEEAQEQEWFWSRGDLVIEHTETGVSYLWL